jgi:1-acyl-sn-glycerol-3-phosphate acyltransferase
VSDSGHAAGEAISRELDGAGSRSKPSGTRRREPAGGRDRSLALMAWYRGVRFVTATLAAVLLRWRATGHRNVPEAGGVLLVSNHLSYLDVFFLGIPLRRPLNYVARSTLFLPVLGTLIRSVGGFPIQREGMGASGMKETLRRLRAGGIVTLFPEGTRSPDGELGALKSGIAVLVARAGVPVVPVGLAGTFEIWPRSRLVPVPHPIRIHYGRPIRPDELAGMAAEAVTALIRERLAECRLEALRGLRRDMTH